MSGKVVYLLIGLTVIFGLISGILFFQNQTLSLEMGTLNTQLQGMQFAYANLQTEYTSFQSEYQAMQTAYNAIQSNYSTLDSNYQQAQQKYDAINSIYSSLYNDLYDFKEDLEQYTSATASFSRVLCQSEYVQVSSAVASATGNNPDGWSSYRKIYNYIHNNIDYARDVGLIRVGFSSVMPTSGPLAGRNMISGLSFYEVDNYIQTPRQTLDLKQGDCEDQAILCYAMIKYHMNEIQGQNYNLYLAHVEFNDGSAHLAVLLPVTGGQLCILDNAGNYLTTSGGSITQRDANTELHNYSNHWSSNGGIDTMILYKVNIETGGYSIFASGSINQVASALGSAGGSIIIG